MAYVLQIACIAVLAEILLRLVPVASAGFRYAYWRLVLAGALVAPWLLSQPPSPDQLSTDVVAAASTAAVFMQGPGVPAALTASATGWLPVLPWILGAGAIVRLLWVLAGVARLRRLRRIGMPVNDLEYDEIQQRLGTHAELRSAHIAQPVTFGLWRPVVLLPVSLEECAPGIRRAAVTHELIHVLRRDWLFVIAEESLRAAFWYHPAIWWMTARVRLTREEFTDHLAVLATGSRRSYMEALLAFADARSLEPAPAFVGRANLFHRIVLLSKESAMSSRRIVVSGVVLTALLGAGGWYASEAFPVTAGTLPSALRPGPPAAQQAGAQAVAVNPITPENPIPRRVFATPIPYPLELAGSGFEAAISVRVVLNANGFVSSVQAGARAVAKPGARAAVGNETQAMERFAAAAVEAIGQWQYEPPASGPLAFYVAATFKPGANATVSQSERPQGVVAGPSGARMATAADTIGFERAIAAQPNPQPGAGARGGGAGTGAAARGAGTAALPGGGPGARSGGAAASAADGGRATGIARSDGGPVRIGGGIAAPKQIQKINPVYPDIARAARVQGVVILEVTIDEQGRVSDVRILRSIPLLDQAAIDAVRLWEYTPTLLNGVPVSVIMTTTVQFSLEQ